MTTTPTKRGNAVAHYALRGVLAVLFVVSAVAKLFAIDDFELYLFSFGLLPLNWCYLLARLCIATELTLGVLLATGWWRKWVVLATLLVLLLFSLFLCYAALLGRTDSCHCIGRMADMNPAQSLLKNAILLILTLLYAATCRHIAPSNRLRLGWRIGIGAAIAVGAVVSVFCISVPDNWMFGPAENRYNVALMQESIGPDGALEAQHIDRGHQLLAFVTPGCPYCRMTRQKIDYIVHLPTEAIHYVEPDDIGVQLFFDITFGQRPLVILLDEGQPTATFHYRNINERQVADFLR